MPLFSRRARTLISDAVRCAWRTEDERQALLQELRDTTVKPSLAVDLIWSGDSAVRQLGVEKFLVEPGPNDVKHLIGQLQDKPRHVRAYVLRFFPRIPPPLLAQVIEDELTHKDPARRRLGWEFALSLSGPSLEGYLKRAVEEGPPAVKISALQKLLKDFGGAQNNKKLVVQLCRASDGRLASVALQAAATLKGDAEIADVMIGVFGGDDATTREIAVAYLREAAAERPREMRGQMLKLLGGGEDKTRRLAVEILLRTGGQVEVLEEILVFCRELVGWLRTRILETLQTFGDQVLEPALQLLDHRDEEVRTGALVLAERFNDPRLIKPVARLLEDDDWWLRITACDTLGRIGDVRAVPHLVQALQDDDSRWAAIDALARIGAPECLKPLTRMLRDKRIEVRREVIRGFARFEDKRLLSILQQIQQRDPSTELRTLASEVERELAAKLNLEARGGDVVSSVSARSLTKPVDRLLAEVRERGASDLHLSVGEPPILRMNGKLVRMDMKPLSAEAVGKAVVSTLDERQRARLRDVGEVDYCYPIAEVGRYRSNAFRQRLGICGTFRVIPNTPPTFADLRIPGRLTELLDYHQGIIVVSGPAGSGKSTTLAAIVNLINETKPEHVLTIEDPVEFVHPVKTALLNQREVGTHTESFGRALRGALREDPDVIVVGELRDADVTRMALTAAETGHLVVATMHTTSAVATIDRLVTSFPADEQQQVRMALSESLKYVVSQQLIPRKDGQGRVAVFEVLKGTPSIGNLIRDNKTFQIPSMMQVGQSVGMQNVDMALMDLYESDLISAETAWLKAEKPALFEAWCDEDFLAEAKSVAAPAELEESA
jgi:twitching motility protein PilT